MWYFTPKADLKFLHELLDDVARFADVITIIKKNANSDIRYMHPDARAAYLSSTEDQPALRATLSKKHKRASELATRYGINITTANVMYTGFIHRARMDIFTALLEPDTAYFDDVAQRAIDSINRCIGACEEKKKADLWHLCNPAYWLFAFFRFVLTSLGLGKLLKENILAGFSIVLSAATAVAFPRLKQVVEAWFRTILQ